MDHINPDYVIAFGILTTIMTGVAGGTVHLTNMVPDRWIGIIKAYAAFFAVVNSAILTGFHYVLKTAPIAAPLLLVLLVSPARAQGPLCDPLTMFRLTAPQAFFAKLKACAADDIAAVVADAMSNPPDYQAQACFLPLQGISDALSKGGVLYAAQRLRRAKSQGILSACNAWAQMLLVP